MAGARNLVAVVPQVNAALKMGIVGTNVCIARIVILVTLTLECVTISPSPNQKHLAEHLPQSARIMSYPLQKTGIAQTLTAVAPQVSAALNTNFAGTQMSIARPALLFTLPQECAATPRSPHRQYQPALHLLLPAQLPVRPVLPTSRLSLAAPTKFAPEGFAVEITVCVEALPITVKTATPLELLKEGAPTRKRPSTTALAQLLKSTVHV